MSDIDEFFDAITKNSGMPATHRDTPEVASPSEDWVKVLASASCWAQAGNSYFPVSDVVKAVPAGAYRCRMSNTGPFVEKMKIQTDSLLSLPDSATEILLHEFSHFWKLQGDFDKRGFTFKRGMLMWGPPGSGKTSAIWQMTQRLVNDHNGIVLFVEHPQVAIYCLTALRKIEPHRPMITVMEDIDSIIGQHGEHGLLSLLDGEFQISNVVHVATTNYPHLLDRRFIDRPSRFDTIMKIGMPSAAAREMYLKTKEPHLDDETIARWVSRTANYSVAHLREVCIATQCFKQPEEAVFARLDKMKELIYLNEDGDDERQAAGFVGNHLRAMRKR